MERKTSEWGALHEAIRRKMQIIRDREVEHAQHVIDHGAPRTKPEVWLAALVLMKANRVWNNMLRGGTKEALLDSALDLGNYADFLSALLIDQESTPIGDLGPWPDPPPIKQVPMPYIPGVILPTTTAPLPSWKDVGLDVPQVLTRSDGSCCGGVAPPKPLPIMVRPSENGLCYACGEPSNLIAEDGNEYCFAHEPVVHQ